MRNRATYILRKSLLGVVALFLVGPMVGCFDFYKEKPLKEAIQDWTGKKLSFQLVQQGIFSPRCVSCHGTSGGVSLESYASVKANLSKIERVALVDKVMPPPPKPSLNSSEQALLRAWIDAGAPETPDPGATPTPTPTPLPPLEPKFASIKKRIFEQRCTGCHSVGGSAEKVPGEWTFGAFEGRGLRG